MAAASVEISVIKARKIAEKTLEAVQKCRASQWAQKIKDYRNNRWLKKWRRPLTDEQIRARLEQRLFGNPNLYYGESETAAERLLILCGLVLPHDVVRIDSDMLQRLITDG